MRPDIDTQFIDRLYEASIIPQLWSDVCDRLGSTVNGFGSTLFTIDPQHTIRWTGSLILQTQMEAYTKSDLRFTNNRPQVALEKWPGEFVRDIDIVPDEEWKRGPIYQEIYAPIGAEWSAAAIIPEPSGGVIIYEVMRNAAAGSFTRDDLARLNGFRPDLARAALLATNMAFRQAQSMTHSMSMLGLPAAVVGKAGYVVALNPELEKLDPHIRVGAYNKLKISRMSADFLFQGALIDLENGLVPKVQSIPIPAAGDAAALLLHIVPVRRSARDIFSRSLAVMIVTPVGSSGLPDERILSGLFDLTPAEARVARGIVGGDNVNEIATHHGISRETVRSQLKAVLGKTGTGRQSELVALLSGLAAVR